MKQSYETMKKGLLYALWNGDTNIAANVMWDADIQYRTKEINKKQHDHIAKLYKKCVKKTTSERR